MISLLLFHKRFTNLTGLIVTCLLYFNCQSFSSSVTDNDIQVSSSSTSGLNGSCTQSNTNPIIIVDAGTAGKSEEKKLKKLGRKPQKGSVYYYGCDTCLSKVYPTGQAILAVADGVGSSVASRSVAGKLLGYIESSRDKNPKDIISDAHTQLKAESCRYRGGATVCMVTIDSSGLLEWANLGDSAFEVIRNNEVVYKAEKKTNHFNGPYYLSQDDCSGKAEQSASGKYQLKKGDIVVMGTDGLFDNLDDQKIISEIQSCTFAQTIANNLVKQAFEISQRKDVETPFQLSISPAIEANDIFAIRYKDHKGGKPDDITVVVAVIK